MAHFLFLHLRRFFCKNPGPLKYMREMGHCIIVVPQKLSKFLFVNKSAVEQNARMSVIGKNIHFGSNFLRLGADPS